MLECKIITLTAGAREYGSFNLRKTGPFILGFREHCTKLSLAAKLKWSHNLFLPQNVLQDVQTEEELEKIIESVQAIQLEETDHLMEEVEAIAQNTDENAIHDEANQSGGEDMDSEQSSISLPRAASA